MSSVIGKQCSSLTANNLRSHLVNKIGRLWSLIQDATIMFIGLLMLTSAWGVTLNGWVICYALSLFFYSIGVGMFFPGILTPQSGVYPELT